MEDTELRTAFADLHGTVKDFGARHLALVIAIKSLLRSDPAACGLISRYLREEVWQKDGMQFDADEERAFRAQLERLLPAGPHS